MNFIKNTLMTLSSQITVTLLSVVGSIVIARVLGPEGKGAYSLILLVPTLLFSLGNLGIQSANTYYGGSGRYKTADLASNSLILGLGLGVIVAAGFLTYFHLYHPSFLEDINPRLILIVTGALPFSFLHIYFIYLLLGEQKITQYNFVVVFQQVLLVVLLLILLLGLGMELQAAVIAWATATVVTGVLPILLVRRLVSIKWSLNSPVFKASVTYGVKSHLAGMIIMLNSRLDMLLVAFFMNVTFVGYYSVSVALAEALWHLPAAVGVVLFARTPRLSTEEANSSTPRIVRNTLFVTVLAATILLPLAKYLITIFFGPAFLPALQPFYILLPGIVALSITRTTGSELAGRGRPIFGLIAGTTSLAVNIPLNLLLIPLWGISGAAFASTVSYSITAIVGLFFFLRISQNTLTDTLILKREDLKTYARMVTMIRDWISARR